MLLSWLGIIFAVIGGFTLLNLAIIEIVISLENRQPGKVLVWSVVLAALPISGLFIFLIFGRIRKYQIFEDKHLSPNKQREISVKQINNLAKKSFSEDQAKKKLAQLSLKNSSALLTANNKIVVFGNAEDKFRELFQALEGANHHIHIEYYILKEDEIGSDLREILNRKSREGVQVRLIVDGLGSHSLTSPFLSSLKQAGVEVKLFFPLKPANLGSKLNLRNHRKIVIVDGQTGFLGGMNVGDEYLSRNPKLGYWRDTHLKVQGEAVHVLQQIFFNDWFFVTGQQIIEPTYYPMPEKIGDHLMQIIAGGPDSPWQSIQQVFFAALTGAEKRIIIETPYFIPNDGIISALQTAALSGVDVKLIVQGVAEYKITYWATRSYYEDLLRAGVKIYQYNKGILHSKVTIVDDSISIVGSANYDLRSFQLDFEINALLYSEEMVKRLESDLNFDLTNSKLINNDDYYQRSLIERLKEANAHLLSPLL